MESLRNPRKRLTSLGKILKCLKSLGKNNMKELGQVSENKKKYSNRSQATWESSSSSKSLKTHSFALKTSGNLRENLGIPLLTRRPLEKITEINKSFGKKKYTTTSS